MSGSQLQQVMLHLQVWGHQWVLHQQELWTPLQQVLVGVRTPRLTLMQLSVETNQNKSV